MSQGKVKVWGADGLLTDPQYRTTVAGLIGRILYSTSTATFEVVSVGLFGSASLILLLLLLFFFGISSPMDWMRFGMIDRVVPSPLSTFFFYRAGPGSMSHQHLR